MPAAAVIPAPIAYIKVVAVKKLVVEFVSRAVRFIVRGVNWRVARRPAGGSFARAAQIAPPRCSSLSVEVGRHFYFEQTKVLKAG